MITNPAHESLINGSVECQRLALLNFFRTSRNQEEGNPIDHTIDNTAILGKLDAVLNPSNTFSTSYNFDHSKNTNQTFDVATYGNSANGIEGPSKINVLNFNLFTTISPTTLNEFHVTYARELRPRNPIESNVPPDTGMGDPAFRFGRPYFLGPSLDELLWRTQIKNNLSMVTGRHTFKVGGEWLHTLNDQVFRGFFNGRYIFSTVSGFLRYASPAGAGGFGPNAVGVLERQLGHASDDRARPAARWRVRHCCSTFRRREPAFLVSIRPESLCSPTKTSRCSRRTNGSSVRTSPSTTGCAGTRS